MVVCSRGEYLSHFSSLDKNKRNYSRGVLFIRFSSMRNKNLLNFEREDLTSSSLESTLLFRKNDSLLHTRKPPTRDGKLVTTPIPTSQVLGKVKDFLGVMAEANKRLLHDARENSSKEYDIEMLNGTEKEYIEMDLVLGVADLNTPEAVAAAESALAGNQPVIPFVDSSSGSDTGDSDEDEACMQIDVQVLKSDKNDSPSTGKPKTSEKIMELL